MSKTPTELAIKNCHPRDNNITFDEGPHIYTVHGKQDYMSTTTWIHTHFSHFDPDASIDGMMKKKDWNTPGHKYYGLTREEIKAKWAAEGADASGKGTDMHYDIECFYNGWDINNDSIEYKYFQKFVKDYPELKPYRTEWVIYHDEIKISGSVDMVFENPDGTIQIYDWKRCKEIPYDAFRNKTSSTECISHIQDCKFWHYSLQLNIYKTILEEKYGKIVTDLYLIALHPDNPYKSYERLKVPFLPAEMESLFALRKQQISQL